MTTANNSNASSKSYVRAVILSGIFGILGIHHFYVERWAMGLFDLGLAIASFVFFLHDCTGLALAFFLVDFVHTIIVTYLLLVGQYKDGAGKLITYPNQKI